MTGSGPKRRNCAVFNEVRSPAVANHSHNSGLIFVRTNSPKWGHDKARPSRSLRISRAGRLGLRLCQQCWQRASSFFQYGAQKYQVWSVMPGTPQTRSATDLPEPRKPRTPLEAGDWHITSGNCGKSLWIVGPPRPSARLEIAIASVPPARNWPPFPCLTFGVQSKEEGAADLRKLRKPNFIAVYPDRHCCAHDCAG